jgi:hypothetical protein
MRYLGRYLTPNPNPAIPKYHVDQKTFHNDLKVKSSAIALSNMSENTARSLRGDLYYAFTPELNKARRRCQAACHSYNTDELATRRRRVELWRA